jgi:hypothetical protein
MARVIYSANPMQPRDGAKLFSADGTFIDFLEKRFPTGFQHPYVVYRRNGRERVELDDFDFQMEPDEVVAILEYPGGAVVPFLAQIAVNLLVSFAVTLILNLLFPPPQPGQGGQPSPVYSFQARQNQARLGEPIPTIYGRMITYPNIVSQPYYRYINGQQYLHMILAIGHGWHQLHRVLIESDDVARLPAGTIDRWMFTPDQHQRKIGIIEAQTGVWEDVVTSPQVAGQRLVVVGGQSTQYGWFEANPEGTSATLIEFDFLFPNGLYWIDSDGDFRAWWTTARMDVQSIDELGNPVGAITTYEARYDGASRSPIRATYSIPVAGGRWRVRVRRGYYSTDQRVVEEMQVIGLRAKLNRTGQAAYGDTTLLVVRVKASEAISDQAQRRIRAEVTRLCSTWRVPGLVASQNPADHFYDILSDPVNGAGRPLSEIDITALAEVHTKWNGKSGFNGQFDQRGTVLGALSAVTMVERGRPVAVGGVMSLITDGPQPVRAAIFTPENIADGTFEVNYLFRQDDTYDGYEVEFFDAKDFTQDVRIWPATSVRPRTIPLLGCTDAGQAERYARLLWQQDIYMRKSVTFETEMEGLIYTLGDRFAVAHPLANWGAAARATSIVGREITLDKAIGPTVDPYVFLRSETGGVSPPLACTLVDDTDLMVTKVILAQDPPFALFGTGTQEPTYVAVGSGQDFVQDFVFTEIEPLQQGTVRITGILYDERVWQGVTG